MFTWMAFASGMLTALMIHLNGALARSLGNNPASVIIHASGLGVVLLLLSVRRFALWRPGVAPWWYGGGAVGFLIVVFANAGFLRLGVALTVGLGMFGQTVSAMVVDHCGWLGVPRVPFDVRKLPCLALIAAGIALMAR
ncbi:MAG: DMT family transporter [Paludibacterium sp.]|uniref:DMT family transporter n=1 Tax=Paludibacterium sp. TaxID=1917523 RepID=UPI0025F90BC7|nr:DMT family transporter [Paludibacterium sp.]MBV8046087.1 DMT family transporter [Paludibacterium sp.]MBV8647420.1 DMT family transporter [Paludibacterium sp.]